MYNKESEDRREVSDNEKGSGLLDNSVWWSKNFLELEYSKLFGNVGGWI